MVTRLFWAIAALYVACALLRLARFNVSNEQGEQHHMSFLGLPTPGAAGAVLGVVIIQQDLVLQVVNLHDGPFRDTLWLLAGLLTVLLPLVVGASALLMISTFRYTHMVNRLTRGRRPIWTLVGAIAFVLLLIVQHRYVLGILGLTIAFSAPAAWVLARLRSRRLTPAAVVEPPARAGTP